MRNGHTLTELLLTMVLLFIIALASAIVLFSRPGRTDLDLAPRRVAALLRDAQTRSMEQASGTVWGVHFDNVSTSSPFYALFSGAYSASSSQGSNFLPKTLRYATSTLGAGSSRDVIFGAVTGAASVSTTITLELLQGSSVLASSSLSVSSSGVVTY